MTNKEFVEFIAKTASENNLIVSITARAEGSTIYMSTARSLDEAMGLAAYASLCARLNAATAIKQHKPPTI